MNASSFLTRFSFFSFPFYIAFLFPSFQISLSGVRMYVYTMDMFLLWFGCKWYGMVHHSSLLIVPFSCVLALRCKYFFVFCHRDAFFVRTVACFCDHGARPQENELLLKVWEHHHQMIWWPFGVWRRPGMGPSCLDTVIPSSLSRMSPCVYSTKNKDAPEGGVVFGVQL